MTLVAVVSLHGAPGATSLACGLAGWAAAGGGRVLLVEADPDGGTLPARFGLRLQPCLTDLAGAGRTGIAPDAVWGFAQPLGRELHAVVAHPGAEQTAVALRACGRHLGEALACADVPVLVDGGRLRPGSPALAITERADRVVVVLRPELAAVMAVLHGLDGLVDPARVALALVGTRPYTARQVSEVTGRRVAGTVPDDPGAVAADPMAWGGRRRNGWVAAVARLADAVGLMSARPQASGPAGDAATAGDHPAPDDDVANASARRS